MRLIWLVMAASPLLGAGDGFVGRDVCASCHAQQAATHAKSGHAHALRPAAEHPLAAEFQGRLARGRYQYRFDVVEGRPTAVVTAGDEALRVVLDWAFGAGEQAVTFVSQLDEDAYVEIAASYYPAGGAIDLTPGHQTLRPNGLAEALGVHHRTFSPEAEILRCFRCHATGPLALDEEFAVQPAELGVECESCHGPGEAHVAAVRAGEIERAAQLVRQPGKMPPAEQLAFCGRCHRPPASDGERIDWSDPWNVRHQPVYLSRSPCFAGGALDCLTCHEAHQPLRRDADGWYAARCGGCHSAETHPPAAVCRASKQSCIDCHMPRVAPHPRLAFHNHWIGVFDAGRPLRPRAR